MHKADEISTAKGIEEYALFWPPNVEPSVEEDRKTKFVTGNPVHRNLLLQ